MTHSHVALLLSCCLLVLALASAEWSTVPLASTADGYDNHDDGGPSQSWIAVLQCEPSATHVPRPISSTMTSDRGEASARMVCAASISAMNVDTPFCVSSAGHTHTHTHTHT